MNLYESIKSNLKETEDLKPQLYEVTKDRQGGSFATDIKLTAQEWKERALDWASNDEAEEIIEKLDTLVTEEEIISYIDMIWDITLEKTDYNEIMETEEYKLKNDAHTKYHGDEDFANVFMDRFSKFKNIFHFTKILSDVIEKVATEDINLLNNKEYVLETFIASLDKYK